MSAPALHKPTGNWRLGLGLSLVTATLWGGLPLALKIVLESLDAATLTWARFLIAGVFIASMLAARGRLPRLGSVSRTTAALLAVATLGLAGNYYFFQLGLSHTGAGAAQVLIQISPVMFLLGTVAIFKERLSPVQSLGVLTLVAGLALFFHHEILGDAPVSTVGYAAILVAAVTWALYALAQKQLLAVLPSPAVMMVVYLGSALIMTPMIHIDRIAALDGLRLAILGYAAANTVIAYGAFAEALAHWEGSRVSAVLALVPVLTLAFGSVAERLWPGLVAAETLTALSYVGAAMVVAGSMMTSLAAARKPHS